jgi:ABC-type molybdate transport system permease subunit
MKIGQDGLLMAWLAAFGRAISEVGAIIIIGGNIRGYTRTMTTAIALETSKGDLSLALALGVILIVLSNVGKRRQSLSRWCAERQLTCGLATRRKENLFAIDLI